MLFLSFLLVTCGIDAMNGDDDCGQLSSPHGRPNNFISPWDCFLVRKVTTPKHSSLVPPSGDDTCEQVESFQAPDVYSCSLEEIQTFLDQGGTFFREEDHNPDSSGRLMNLQMPPLMIACLHGDLEIVSKILEDLNASYFINMRDRCGDTALSTAIVNGDIEMIRVLLDHGADTQIINAENNNAYQAGIEELRNKLSICPRTDPIRRSLIISRYRAILALIGQY